MRKLLSLVLVAGLLFVGGCKTTKQKEEEQEAAATVQRTEMDHATEQAATGQDHSFDDFISDLRQAVSLQDMHKIASMMTPNFGYRFEPVGEGAGVFKYWDEENIWDELQLVTHDEFVRYNGYMVSPPEFADPSIPYQGYRAGVMKLKGQWKFAYFVKD